MLVWENTRQAFRDAREMTSEERQAQIAYRWHATIQIWVVLPIGPAAKEICFNQSKALSRSGQWHVISIKFLRSFLRRHSFAGKLKVACTSRKAGCSIRRYLRQEVVSTLNFAILHNKTVLQARAKTGNIRTPLRDYLWKRLRENSNKEQYKLRLS